MVTTLSKVSLVLRTARLSKRESPNLATGFPSSIPTFYGCSTRSKSLSNTTLSPTRSPKELQIARCKPLTPSRTCIERWDSFVAPVPLRRIVLVNLCRMTTSIRSSAVDPRSLSSNPVHMKVRRQARKLILLILSWSKDLLEVSHHPQHGKASSTNASLSSVMLAWPQLKAPIQPL